MYVGFLELLSTEHWSIDKHVFVGIQVVSFERLPEKERYFSFHTTEGFVGRALRWGRTSEVVYILQNKLTEDNTTQVWFRTKHSLYTLTYTIGKETDALNNL